MQNFIMSVFFTNFASVFRKGCPHLLFLKDGKKEYDCKRIRFSPVIKL